MIHAALTALRVFRERLSASLSNGEVDTRISPSGWFVSCCHRHLVGSAGGLRRRRGCRALIGLKDRIEALGGTMRLVSRRGSGISTRQLPLGVEH